MPLLTTDCSFTINENAGVLTSPNYPGYYDANLNCNWLISTTSAFVRFRINNLISEQNYDTIQIYDGPTNHSNRLLLTSGWQYSNLGTIVSSSNQMLVLFKSDSQVQYQGFAASFYGLENKNENFINLMILF